MGMQTPADGARSLRADAAGFWQAVAQSMAVGPLFASALFGGIIAGIAGSAGPFVLVVTTIGIVAVSFVFATFARRHPNAGSIYGFFRRGTRSPGVATFGAGIYFYGLLFLGAGGIYIGFGTVFQQFAARYLGFSPPWWAPALLTAVLVCVITILGLRPSVRVQLAILAVSAIPFLILAGKILAVGGAHGDTGAAFDPTAPTAGDIFTAFLFCIILFVGFELSSALGEEARRPTRTIPWAVLTTVVIVGCFFILMEYVGTIGFGLGTASKTWGASPNGLAVLGGRYVGEWDEVWIYVSVLLDMIGVAIGFTVSLARGLFSLGRDGMLPEWFSGLSRTRVPFRANVVILAGAFAIVGGFDLASVQPLTGFSITAAVGALLMLLVYIGLGVVLMARPGRGKVGITLMVMSAGAIAMSGLGIYGTVQPFPTGPARWEIWLALIGVGLGAVLACVTVARKARATRAGATVATVAPTPPSP